MSSIKVAVRCRPFTRDDKLGVHMIQNSEDEGEINLLNSDYSTKRFAFSYSWWTAFNWKHHVTSNKDICESMPITQQDDVYKNLGQKIKTELYDGNAIVLFAYGLSGSGKTFTVFGMDAVDNPDSWFHQKQPHSMWGLFPHLAYDIFQEKGDGWKISMKYFQNVVDIVRDLMSPTCEERVYKEGMKKDGDGFTDITWCKSVPINSWDELRTTFLKANARKAIAPTQFNHQSTRGHCILVLDVVMPDKNDPSMKKRGRVYVCDLAGTEPAGDIVYAQYEKVTMPDGTVEQKFVGAHRDQKKTKELQDQGKKINLSLSEMAQFFMKMADAFKKKKLKPGVSIPGCNSYFLCKFLKDTLLQSKTYLFCAIRPEVEFLKYTFATLGFAKNASVVQLAPRKATTATSAAERKLMAELEKYKQMVAELQKGSGAKEGDAGDAGDGMAELQAQLEQARAALNQQVQEEGQDNSSNEALQRQAEQYAKRGISLTELNRDCSQPHFINLDEDPFRSKRFLYILKAEGPTVFGPKCDIAPPSFSLKPNHCTVVREPAAEGGAAEKFFLVGGKGRTIVKGKGVAEGDRVELHPFDWVAMGTETMIFSVPGFNPSEAVDTEDVFDELQDSMSSIAAMGGGGGSDGAGGGDQELLKRIQFLEQQNAELNSDKEGVFGKSDDDVGQMDEQAIIAVYKRCKDVELLCKELDRDLMDFEPALMRSVDSSQVKVTVKITNKKTQEEIVLNESDFASAASVLSDEKFKLQMALENGDEYAVPQAHDPLMLMYDNNCFHLGSAVLYPEYLLYNLDTDDMDCEAQLKRAVSPYDPVGFVRVKWSILANEDAEPGEGEVVDIDDVSNLLGKSWTGLLEIEKAIDLPVMVDQAYVQYEFFGADGKETFTSENVMITTHSPTWQYRRVHHVPVVTQDFIDYLSSQWHVHIYVSPYMKNSSAPISTANSRVREAFGASPVANDVGGTDKAAWPQEALDRISALEAENEALRTELATLKAKYEGTSAAPGTSVVRNKLEEARVAAASITAETEGTL